MKYPDKSNISKKEFIDLTIDDCNALRQGNYAKMNLRELVAFGLQSKLKKLDHVLFLIQFRIL